jgi:glutathione S-transferase
MGVIPGGWVSNITELVNQKERTELLASLEQLATSVQASPWLVGDSMTLADIAVAAQLSLLRFPSSAGLSPGRQGGAWAERSPQAAAAVPVARPDRTQIDGADPGRGVKRNW